MVKLIKGESDLATLHPDLVKEWHPIKNGDLMPEDISSGSGKEVWWLCPEGHTYSMVVNQRTKRGYAEGSPCAGVDHRKGICQGEKVLYEAYRCRYRISPLKIVYKVNFALFQLFW